VDNLQVNSNVPANVVGGLKELNNSEKLVLGAKVECEKMESNYKKSSRIRKIPVTKSKGFLS
jgi:hypothetical protein